MKKLIYLIVVIVALGLIVSGCIPVVPPTEQNELSSTVSKTIVSEGVEYIEIINNEHKIRNKWDLKGTFENNSSHLWGNINTSGVIWKYGIHIKEAMNGEYSVGTIYFNTTAIDGTEIEVIGHVKQTKSDYLYWYNIWKPRQNLAAAGIAEYNGVTYNFLFLYMDNYMWFALTHDNINSAWEAETAKGFNRCYQLHSKYGESFTFIPKIIHE